MVLLISSILILFVNLITTEYIADKKFKPIITYLLIIGYTLIMIGLSRYVIPVIFNGSVTPLIFMLISWSYLILFSFIYQNNLKTIIMIMAFSLSHTLLVNGLIYHVFIILFDEYVNIYFILIQLLVFLFTTPLMILLIKNTLKKITDSFNQFLYKTLIFLPLFNFLIMYVSRYLIEFNSIITALLFYSTMFSMIVLSYYLIYKIIKSSDNINTLNTLVYIDPLTKLKNRLALYIDFANINLSQDKYQLYFMDLNKLKSINDDYGHIKGDEYLNKFSESLKKTFNKDDNIYRISGDEFIVLSKTKFKSLAVIKDNINKHFKYSRPFLGVSVGYVTYPDDGSTLDGLLNLADQNMYKDKNSKD
ncbi:MAG: GGDEF domain-containing protein [Candidatus Izimaplasma sp.]|nr:GGDEF domain-containing protein [Candidatus Izimaplasma bacterium]